MVLQNFDSRLRIYDAYKGGRWKETPITGYFSVLPSETCSTIVAHEDARACDTSQVTVHLYAPIFDGLKRRIPRELIELCRKGNLKSIVFIVWTGFVFEGLYYANI